MALEGCPHISGLYRGVSSKAVARGGFLGSEEPPQTKKGPPKGPLECTKRSTITVCLINDAAYYADIDLDTTEDLNKFCYPIS